MISLPRALSSALTNSKSAGFVGIDVGTYSVKTAQVQREGNRFTLRAGRALPHRKPLNFDDREEALAQIVESIERVWSPARRWFTEDAACVLPMNATTFRTMNLPRGTVVEQQAMIREELADETGTSANSWTVACWPDRTEGQQEAIQSVSALGVEQGFANDVLEALLRRGLSCRIMTGHPQVQARAAELAMGSRAHEHVALLDWGYESAVLTIAGQGSPKYTRCLRECGFHSVLQTVGSTLNLSETDASQLICGASFADSSEADQLTTTIRNLASGPLQRLVDELNRTFLYVRQKNPALDPERLMLHGGGATLRGLDSLLYSSTRLPTQVWDIELDRRGTLPSRTPPAALSSAIVLSTMRWKS